MPTTVCRLVRRSELKPGSVITMPRGTIKRIHVNQHMIRRNKAKGEHNNVITIQWRNKSYPVADAQIHGPAKAVYSPDKPLSCGAHVWVETTAEVTAVC
jgi:hypothetical protein